MKVLTPAAEDDRNAFERQLSDSGCSCHIAPPCAHCTHPGNPVNQEEDEYCWVESGEI